MAHKILGTPQIPLNAAAGKIFKSDASGNATWASDTTSIAYGRHTLGTAFAAGTYIFYETGAAALAAVGSAFGQFYLDPADYIAQKVRVRAWMSTNAVAPAANFTFHLYPVATRNGASGARVGIATVGTSVTNAAINAPALSTTNQAASADAAFPAAGYYVLALVVSATTAANSTAEVGCRLDARNT
jgi:hypothetical protein